MNTTPTRTFLSAVKRVIAFEMAFSLLVATAEESQSIAWTTLDFPGAENTFPLNIDGKNIVGWYNGRGIDMQFKEHGFLYDGIAWATLDFPGAYSTFPYGIDDGRVVGTYDDYSGRHGFLYDGTKWETISYPGAEHTSPRGIDGNKIVGWYQVAEGLPQHGFIFDGRNWVTLDFPGALHTQVNGIHENNIVGNYFSLNLSDGFLFDGTSWMTLHHPAPETGFAEILGIDKGNIVGTSAKIFCWAHGFIFDSQVWKNFDYPDATETWAYGIDGIHVVGYYYNPNEGPPSWRGFIATIPEPTTAILMAVGFAIFGASRVTRAAIRRRLAMLRCESLDCQQ